jgi:hypothetical protein
MVKAVRVKDDKDVGGQVDQLLCSERAYIVSLAAATLTSSAWTVETSSFAELFDGDRAGPRHVLFRASRYHYNTSLAGG